MKIIQIKQQTSKWLSELAALYQSAFPKNERRNFDKLIYIIENEKRFYCNAIIENKQFIGLITTWEFDTFIYVEHFAISEAVRGNGYGKKVLSFILQQSTKPMVLEVEIPETEIAKRRILFYQQFGFKVIRTAYQQPAYRQTDYPIPMYLMCTSSNFTDLQINLFQKAVYYTY